MDINPLASSGIMHWPSIHLPSVLWAISSLIEVLDSMTPENRDTFRVAANVLA